MPSISLYSYWGERERAPTLLMIVYVRPRPIATLRMRERCSNSAGFRNQLVLELFVSGPGNVMGAYIRVVK